MNLISNDKKYLMVLDVIPCHRKKSRSITLRGKTFPICARCMSISLGFLAIPILLLLDIHLSLIWVVLLNIPMVVDGYTQRKRLRLSNNFLRIITGLLSGIGLSIFVVTTSFYIVKILT